MSFYSLIPALALVSHLVLLLIVAALLFRHQWGNKIVSWLTDKSLLIGFLISLAATIGSLVYSEVLGFTPCVLCWYQRLFIYPQVILFGLAWWHRDYSIGRYLAPLSIIGGIISLYHSYTQLGGVSLLPCTATGAECSKVFVMEFGYITIPAMALTTFIYLFIFSRLAGTR